MHRADIRCRVRYDRGMHCVLALDGESGRPVLEGREQMPALYGREQMTCSLWKRAGGQAVSVGLRERHSGCLRGGGGRGYSLASSPAGVWRFGGDGGVKSGSGNLVTACHDLLLFVLPNSSSNQPSNFALRILVGEMSPGTISRTHGGCQRRRGAGLLRARLLERVRLGSSARSELCSRAAGLFREKRAVQPYVV